MSLAFRKQHALRLLEEWEKSKFPLDRLLATYFRSNRAIGSKDRKWISEKIYFIFRNLGLLDADLPSPITWPARLESALAFTPKPTDLPKHIAVSFPKALFELLEKRFKDRTSEICDLLTKRAPFCIRANALKTNPKELMEKLSKSASLERGSLYEHSIYCNTPINVFTLDEFKQGLFEVQDEGSAYIASLIESAPKTIVCDYCSGSGGKTLAMAHKMEHSGQILLHDIRPRAIAEAKKRLKRAGIQNVQYLAFGQTKKWNGKVDHLILDVPCSGTGTYRRNPDLKWKFSKEMLGELVAKQKKIFAKSYPLVKKEGLIYYMTCSLLLEENEEQVEFFLKTYDLSLEKQLLLEPKDQGNDGFFVAIFKKTS